MKKTLLVIFAVLVLFGAGVFLHLNDSLLGRHHCGCQHLSVQNSQTMTTAPYGGIGLSIVATNKIGGPFMVVSVFPGSPAEMAGLKAKDYIIAVDGNRFTPTTTADDASALLRGDPGQTVSITVIRLDSHYTPSEITVTLTRAMIAMPK